MRKSICLILAMILSAGPLAQMSFGFKNPLKDYNLYEDVHKDSQPNDERETVMGEMFYSQNGLNKGDSSSGNRKTPPAQNPTAQNGKGFNDAIGNIEVPVPITRNEYLRQSSRKRYGSGGAPRWNSGKAFYENPNLESIKEKYRASNYAGCMQECEAYVRLHPNDTLGFYYLAMCYAKADDIENAVKAYEKVISLNDNPMIVKYATNGRNCLIKDRVSNSSDDNKKEEEEIKCFENVNEPEYVYPYREIAKSIEMTPVNPQSLIERNINALQDRISPTETAESTDDKKKKDGDGKIKLPFGAQDSALDEFIRAPYGSGLSPQLEKEYKQIQLHEFQQNLNHGNDINKTPGKYYQNLRNMKEKDNKKSESETIKLALADNDDLKDFFNSPEYIQNKKELDQIRMMFGDYKSENGTNSLTDIIPALSQGDEKLSPQAMQMIMMQSVMPDIINIDGNSSF